MHFLFSVAGDCGGPDYQRHPTRLQDAFALGRIYNPELDAVWVAEDVAGDLSGEVDIEALRLARSRISRAEEIRVLVDTDDKPAALEDRRHSRARWHGARRGQRPRAQAGLGITVRIPGKRRGGDLLRTVRPRVDRCDRHRRRRCRGLASGA